MINRKTICPLDILSMRGSTEIAHALLECNLSPCEVFELKKEIRHTSLFIINLYCSSIEICVLYRCNKAELLMYPIQMALKVNNSLFGAYSSDGHMRN